MSTTYTPFGRGDIILLSRPPTWLPSGNMFFGCGALRPSSRSRDCASSAAPHDLLELLLELLDNLLLLLDCADLLAVRNNAVNVAV